MVEWLFLTVPWGCLRFVIVIFLDHTHYFYTNYLILTSTLSKSSIPKEELQHILKLVFFKSLQL